MANERSRNGASGAPAGSRRLLPPPRRHRFRWPRGPRRADGEGTSSKNAGGSAGKSSERGWRCANRFPSRWPFRWASSSPTFAAGSGARGPEAGRSSCPTFSSWPRWGRGTSTGDPPPVKAIFYGVSPAVIALIVYSCYRLARLGMEDRLQWVIAAGCFVVTVALQAEAALLFLVSGAIGIA
ncbi:MAG TPA: chromate transporter [bacterium]|nr:chromate transporter [bacterium]